MNLTNYQNLTKKSIVCTSLFDGCSTAYVALERAGFEIKKYYSSEIDKNALKVQNHHYGNNENFIPLGDVKNVNAQDIIDTQILIFGSPCTSISSINSKTPELGFNGASGLFFEAIRILKDLKRLKPANSKLYFICENVVMSNKNRDIMTKALKEIFPDTQLIKINGSLVNACHRRRYYWSNIGDLTQPEPTGIKFSDILENGFTDKEKGNVILGSSCTLTNGIFRHYKMSISNIVFKEKWFADLPIDEKLNLYPQILKDSGYDSKSKKDSDILDFPNGNYRLITPLEAERCLGFDDHYISGVPNVSKTEKLKIVGLSFSPDVIAHIAKPLLWL